jgi:hypothetical protein
LGDKPTTDNVEFYGGWRNRYTPPELFPSMKTRIRAVKRDQNPKIVYPEDGAQSVQMSSRWIAIVKVYKKRGTVDPTKLSATLTWNDGAPQTLKGTVRKSGTEKTGKEDPGASHSRWAFRFKLTTVGGPWTFTLNAKYDTTNAAPISFKGTIIPIPKGPIFDYPPQVTAQSAFPIPADEQDYFVPNGACTKPLVTLTLGNVAGVVHWDDTDSGDPVWWGEFFGIANNPGTGTAYPLVASDSIDPTTTYVTIQ